MHQTVARTVIGKTQPVKAAQAAVTARPQIAFIILEDVVNMNVGKAVLYGVVLEIIGL
jgi:hypothetical protein